MKGSSIEDEVPFREGRKSIKSAGMAGSPKKVSPRWDRGKGSLG